VPVLKGGAFYKAKVGCRPGNKKKKFTASFLPILSHLVKKNIQKVKNASAQAWAFKSLATIINTGEHELKGWQLFVHKEILLSASGAIVVNGDDFPVAVGNGTIFAGNPQVDLKTAIETAEDFTQISA